ncbi:parvalbumin beta-like [Leptodactylus fuscus]|uniref:parvalbumin beta-like n=1 Tax=Leptodactylus fuscus TaxID=238119 RepID=UPI003F4F1606
MSITDFLDEKKIDAALASVAAGNSFHYKSFFQKSGLSGKSTGPVKKVFEILDRNDSGFIEEDELTSFLQNFRPDARLLTEDEVKEVMKDGDSDKDGKIAPNNFQAMVKSAGAKKPRRV